MITNKFLQRGSSNHHHTWVAAATGTVRCGVINIVINYVPSVNINTDIASLP